MGARILFVGQSKNFTKSLSSISRQKGHSLDLASTLKKGLQSTQNREYDLIFLDILLPDGNGLDRLKDFYLLPSEPEVILLTEKAAPEEAEQAIISGAWDYVEKTATDQDIELLLLRALRHRENQGRPKTVPLNRLGIVGSSPEMLRIMAQVAQASSSTAPVLLTGETGTGKDLIARAIHDNGPLAQEAFIVVDCASLTESLTESILFGYAKGAFTGAETSKKGLLKLADQGTLFLDEIGELKMEQQKILLRVLETQRFRPVGAKKEEQSRFRLISATNQDPEAMLHSGDFREDLYYRIKAIPIHLSPLRERKEDLKSLVQYHLTRICERDNLEIKSFTRDFLMALTAHDWPGNIRELVQTLEFCLSSAGAGPMLYPQHLPLEMRANFTKQSLLPCYHPSQSSSTFDSQDQKEFPTWKDYRQSVVNHAEKEYLNMLLKRTNQSISEACKLSGLSRSRLYYMLKKHGLTGSSTKQEPQKALHAN